jgi:hypothetical protein
MELLDGLRVEPQVPSDWRVFERNFFDSGDFRTVRAAFWHVPMQQLWVDPNICGGAEAIERAITDRVALVMLDNVGSPMLLAPADWTKASFPDNSQWVALLEEKWRQQYPPLLQ